MRLTPRHHYQQNSRIRPPSYPAHALYPDMRTQNLPGRLGASALPFLWLRGTVLWATANLSHYLLLADVPAIPHSCGRSNVNSFTTYNAVFRACCMPDSAGGTTLATAHCRYSISVYKLVPVFALRGARFARWNIGPMEGHLAYPPLCMTGGRGGRREEHSSGNTAPLPCTNLPPCLHALAPGRSLF